MLFPFHMYSSGKILNVFLYKNNNNAVWKVKCEFECVLVQEVTRKSGISKAYVDTVGALQQNQNHTK